MTLKELLIQELDQTPDILVEQLLNFLRFLKSNYYFRPQISQPAVAAPSGPLSDTERLARLNQLFGAWAGQPDLDEIFATIDQERHASRGRTLDSFD